MDSGVSNSLGTSISKQHTYCSQIEVLLLHIGWTGDQRHTYWFVAICIDTLSFFLGSNNGCTVIISEAVEYHRMRGSKREAPSLK